MKVLFFFLHFLSGSHRRKRTDGLFRRPLGRSGDAHCHGNGGGMLERSSPPVTGHFSPRELLLGRGQVLTPPLDSPERRRRSAAAAATVTMTVSRHESLRRPDDAPAIRRSSSGQHGFGSRGRDHDALVQVRGGAGKGREGSGGGSDGELRAKPNV